MRTALLGRRVAAIMEVALLAVFVLLNFYSGYGRRFDGPINGTFPKFRSVSVSCRNRKLLLLEHEGGDPSQTERVGEECSRDDIMVHQGATTPLPNGIPTYTVEVLNVCSERSCSIGRIHLSCGWFSSARLINPRVFRRLRYNDCLLNDGRPLPAGSSVSFQYANSFRFPLAVSSATCLHSSYAPRSP
ncbi:TPD1 protein homolog 1-like [Elaeis guineensis]|uniref:TPD1 protein homolog 1-like n=1 Tax=Elaeis guineensis var. tenera TaxID=51953 RepID=A0A6I9SJ06_ELAGV|nr:TPD1 protein homolog 1-like [Elaeis guineensis]